MIYSANTNLDALQSAVEGVEDNININDGTWSDWTDAGDIADVYEIEDLCVTGREILGRAITSNGDSLRADLYAAHEAVVGFNYHNNFFNRG